MARVLDEETHYGTVGKFFKGQMDGSVEGYLLRLDAELKELRLELIRNTKSPQDFPMIQHALDRIGLWEVNIFALLVYHGFELGTLPFIPVAPEAK